MYRASGAVFLFMYLKKLYKQSKLWFVFVILFAIGQLSIDYKHSVELSPFYHYNMFSAPVYFTGTYKATEVTINGKRLQPQNFTPNGWDNVVMPIIQYQNQQQWNSLIYNTTIQRLLHTNDSALYTNRLSPQAFNDWYRHRILRLLQVNDTNATVSYRIVSYQQLNGSL